MKYGRVKVDGEIIKDPKFKVDTDSNIVELFNKVVKYQKYMYIMLNKPTGVVSATIDNLNETVIDTLGDKYKHMELFPVGRLDIDTVGLVILSNDGQFAHNTLSPKRHVTKIYYAKIKGVVDDEDVEAFYQGIEINNGYLCKPAILKIIKSDDISEITVQIQEGKFHQIKKMFESCGKKVIYLKRIEFCGIELDESLEERESRELNAEEMKLIDDYISKD